MIYYIQNEILQKSNSRDLCICFGTTLIIAGNLAPRGAMLFEIGQNNFKLKHFYLF